MTWRKREIETMKQALSHVDGNDTSQEHVDKAEEKRHEPLTNEQITEIYTKWESTKGTSWADLMRAVEAAHGIKE